VSLAVTNGIDLLGDLIEATENSINPDYYGVQGFHNAGHILISLALDPFSRSGLPPGVMGDPGTAMRDIIFYPYHTFVDDVFEAHKRTLQPYTLTGVRIVGVSSRTLVRKEKVFQKSP
jgi:tyrosinase